MKKTINITRVAVFFSFLSLLITACDSDMPIYEMAMAKQAIRRAKEVKADKYDPENLKSAQKFLYDSHAEVKKDEQKMALEYANKSLQAANKAIETSLPLLSQDILSEIVKLYSTADSLYAEKFAQEKFELAWKSIKHSEQLQKDKKYWESYQNSLQAKSSLEEIIAICTQEMDNMKNEIAELQTQYDELNSSKNRDAAKDELAEAELNIKGAQTSLENKNLKETLKNVNSAKDSIRLAKNKIYKLSLVDRIKELREAIKRLKDERGSEFADDDLENASTLLNEGETLADQEKIDEAIIKVDDAEKAYNSAKDKTKKGLALEKIVAVEKLLEQLRKRDKDNHFENEITNGAGLISESKDLVENKLYANSIKKANEAEKLLHDLAIAIDKKYGKAIDVADELDDGESIYVVKYNKKKRDCLWRISLKVYKDAKMWPVIYMANKNQIKDPDLIFPGQKFKIPSLNKIRQAGDQKDKTESTDENKVPADDNTIKPETDELIQ